MIKKSLVGAAIALGLIVTPAMASLNQFYHAISGQWSIEGYVGSKNFCAAKLYYTDDSYVSIFNMQGTKIVSMMVHNTDWDIVGDKNVTYLGYINFNGKIGNKSNSAFFELKDSQTIVFRDLTETFLDNWMNYRTMTIVMPSSIGNLEVPLRGTGDIVPNFAECIDILNGNSGD